MSRWLRRTCRIGLLVVGCFVIVGPQASAEVSLDLIVQVSTLTGDEVVRDARVWVAPVEEAERLTHHLFRRKNPVFEGRSAQPTDPQGRARFEGLAAGRFVVGAVAPGKAPSMAQVTLRPGVGEAAEIELRLASEVEMHVELVGALARDEILDDAWIVFEGVDTGAETESVPDLWLDSFSHHGAGPLTRYVILRGLAPGAWDVRLVRQTAGVFELLARQQVSLKEVPQQHVRMPLEMQVLDGRLLLAGRPWPEVKLSLGGRSVETDRDGRFSLVAVGPGPYAVEIKPGEDTSLSLPFVELSSSTSSRLEIPDLVLRGRVVDERGGAVSGATVEARRRVVGKGPLGQEATELMRSRTVSRVDGSFDLHLPAGGSWSLAAHTEVLAGAPVTVEAGDEEPVNLVLGKKAGSRSLDRCRGPPGCRRVGHGEALRSGNGLSRPLQPDAHRCRGTFRAVASVRPRRRRDRSRRGDDPDDGLSRTAARWLLADPGGGVGEPADPVRWTPAVALPAGSRPARDRRVAQGRGCHGSEPRSRPVAPGRASRPGGLARLRSRRPSAAPEPGGGGDSLRSNHCVDAGGRRQAVGLCRFET